MAVACGQQISDDIGGNAEQAGMAERHQAGIADENVKPQREHRVEQDLARDIDVIDLLDRVRHRDQRQDGDGDGDAARNDAAHRLTRHRTCHWTCRGAVHRI